MFQSINVVIDLIAHIELLLCPKLRKHILLLCHRSKFFLVSGRDAPGNILSDSRLIAVRKAGAPIHIHLFAVPIYLAFVRIKIHLKDAQIIHAERLQDIVTALPEFPEQIALFQA